MKMKISNCACIIALLSLLNGANVMADVPSGYQTEIPAKILTPDEVETRLGTLKFFDGLPTTETVNVAYENLDFIRGVRTFWTPSQLHP